MARNLSFIGLGYSFIRAYYLIPERSSGSPLLAAWQEILPILLAD